MNRLTGRLTRSAALLAIFCNALFLAAGEVRAALIAYWDFNDSQTGQPADLIVDQGAGTMSTNFDSPATNVIHSTGTSIGALPGIPPANRDITLIAGSALVNNGRSLTIAINTTGQNGMVMTYARRRSDQGFNSVLIEYSTNGGSSWTVIGAPDDPPIGAFALKTVDFGNALDNNPNIQIRWTFSGATNSTGNNRMDNIHVFSGGIPTGACCVNTNCTIETRDNCLQNLNGNYLGDGTACGTCPDYAGIVINEIRADQTGTDTDEYFEIKGPPGASLNGLTYLVVGDGAAAAGSGVVELALDLSGHTIPAGGHFLVALDNDTLQVLGPNSPHVAADMLAELTFENADNTTHMLVSGWRGAVDMDLDVNNDCQLDANPPWVQELDRIAIVLEDNPPGLTECHYGDFFANPPTAIGPEPVGANLFTPGHVFRYDANQNPPDGPGRAWRIGPFNPLRGDDTPRAVNALSTGACCNGSTCTVQVRDNCPDPDVNWRGRDTACTPNPCVGACCNGQVCTIDNQTNCVALGYVYQGDQTTCSPVNPCLACTNVATARALPLNSGTRICNAVVTSRTDLVSSTNNKNFMIQDTSGVDGQSGITVFGLNAAIDSALFGVSLGDMIDIQGTIIEFSSLLELSTGATPLATFQNHGQVGVPAPLVITAAQLQDGNPAAEAIESEYVQLNCVAFLDGDGTRTFAALTNYPATDGINTFTVRIATANLDWVGSTIPTGPVNLRGIVTQFDTTAPFDGGYQILVRGRGILPNDPDDLDENVNCGTTGACCVAGQVCRADMTQTLCVAVGGKYMGDATNCGSVSCPSTDGVVINEVRVDQPTAGDPDDYFELKGPPGVPIGTLTYLVVGDGAAACGSGVVEAVIPLTYRTIPASGIFLAAKNTYTLGGTVNLTIANLNFEEDDNVTHMLVENYVAPPASSCSAGTIDLDSNDDGVLDTTPWSRVLSAISIVKNVDSPPTGTEHYYAPTVGPVPGGFSPGHVIRCPGALNDFIIGSFDIPVDGGNDTAGAENDCTAACLTCPGDTDGSEAVDLNDIDEFVNALLDITPNPCADVNVDNKINGHDARLFIRLMMATPVGTSCLPPSHQDVVRCDNATPPNDCPNNPGVWCIYTVDPGQAGIAPCVIVTGPSGPTTLAENEQFCVQCPGGTCGTLGGKVLFRWENYNGSGNDCTFLATLANQNCTDCFSSNKRFKAPPPPDQIKIMDWNILNYQSGRENDFKTVINAVLPDVIICQEVNGTTGRTNFLNNILNGAGGPGGFASANFTDGFDTDNALYYRTSRITFNPVDYTTVSTSPRITDRWKIGVVGYSSPDTHIYIYSMHLKAGSTPQDQTDRLLAAQAIRAHANNLPAGANIILAGDFNIQSSSEGSYVEFTGSQGDNDGRVFDPINRPGTWNLNPSFASIHTQSPHQNNAGAPPGATNGGLDDRFDFMLCSSALLDGLGTTYKIGSYRAYGNDGNHFNNDINDPPTIPEGAAIANALHAASDHLPVVMEIILPTQP